MQKMSWSTTQTNHVVQGVQDFGQSPKTDFKSFSLTISLATLISLMIIP